MRNENLPQVFKGQQVRSLFKDDVPVWVVKDVCNVLDIKNSRQAISRLDDDEKDDVILNDTIGRPQRFKAVNESGLYHLIVRSDKPVAKEFRRWITHEVLPALRSKGSYSMTESFESSELAPSLLQQKYMALQEKHIEMLEDRLERYEKPKKRIRKDWNDKDKNMVLKLLRDDVNPSEIAKMFNVTRSAITSIRWIFEKSGEL